MRSLKFLSSLIVLGSVLSLGAITASADQIVMGGSSIGSVTISCPGGMAACTMSLVPSGNLGATNSSTGFESPSGTQISTGSYNFSGGPSTLQSSNGGISFTVGGAAWGFTFTDSLGNSLTASADWSTFFNSSSFGFQVGQLDFSTISISCGVTTPQFCTDFAGGGQIDLTLMGITQDVGSLWASENGGTETGITVESGSITTTVPEPGTLALFGTGLLSLAGIARRRFGKF